MNVNYSKVTVIVPNYNHARYLSARLDSILQQTYQDVEIILMDDCSSDNSREILTSYAARDARIQLVFNEQNSGSTFKQWNKGIELAQGEYIWIAESDDYAHPSFLTTLVTQLDANPDVGLAYCDSISVDENSNILEEWKNKFALSLDTTKWQQNFTEGGKDFIRHSLSYVNTIPNASAVLLRREVLVKIGVADENTFLAGDWLYWIRILSQSDVAYSSQAYNYFRTHTNNVRSKTAVNGVLLEELLRVLLTIKQIVGESQRHTETVEHIVQNWFLSFVRGGIPLARHRRIAAAINKIYGDEGNLLFRKITSFLTKNKLSGTRMILGDGIIYKFIRKVKPTS